MSLLSEIATNGGRLVFNGIQTEYLDGGTFIPRFREKYPIKTYTRYGEVTVIILSMPPEKEDEKKGEKSVLSISKASTKVFEKKDKDYVECTASRGTPIFIIDKEDLKIGPTVLLLEKTVLASNPDHSFPKRYNTPSCFYKINLNGQVYEPLFRDNIYRSKIIDESPNFF